MLSMIRGSIHIALVGWFLLTGTGSTKETRNTVAAIALLLLNNDPSATPDRHVSVYYYPWYGKSGQWSQGTLRQALNPAQPPLLGAYSCRDPQTVAQHIAWSETYGIDSWICSWWGPDSWEDVTLRSAIVPNLNGHTLRFAIFYESANLLGMDENGIQFDQEQITLFRDHLMAMANAYFNHPNYLRIDGRPVVYLYLTRAYRGNYALAFLLARLALMDLGHDVFLVGDEVYWDQPNEQRIALLDAVTAYNMHGPTAYADYPETTRFWDDVAATYATYRAACDRHGTALIPNVMPGFNDRGVRLSADHYTIPPSASDGADPTDTFRQGATMAGMFLDSRLNMVCITSFNEWHEDTQIEPTVLSAPTRQDRQGGVLTQGYAYTGYGTALLEAVRDLFGGGEGNTD